VSEKVIILGSGPAGLTAAIYASRANLSPLLVSGRDAGGQLMITTDVENYPAFPKGILGPELIQLMRDQAERFGTRFLTGSVTSVDLSKRPFNLKVEDQETLQTETLIIATGASAQLLGLPSEKTLMGHGVSACATCDGPFFKGKEVVVVGGGDTAVEEAAFLTKFCPKVTIVHRRDQLRASKIMQERAKQNPKIQFIWNSVIEEILDSSQQKVRGVVLKDVNTDKKQEFRCEGVFIAIGHKPNTELFEGKLEMEKGYIVTKGQTTYTNVTGIFACGDVQDHRYRQAITAAGSGCMAAIDAERFLEEQTRKLDGLD
jgi:thioredoxin reductase (NADPH)